MRVVEMSELYGLEPYEHVRRFDQLNRGSVFYLEDYDYETDTAIVGRRGFFRKIGESTAIFFRDGVRQPGETVLKADDGVICRRDA